MAEESERQIKCKHRATENKLSQRQIRKTSMRIMKLIATKKPWQQRVRISIAFGKTYYRHQAKEKKKHKGKEKYTHNHRAYTKIHTYTFTQRNILKETGSSCGNRYKDWARANA